MTGQLKSQTFLLMLFSILGLFFFAINGQASAALKPVEARGEGANDISGFAIDNIHYDLLPHDPTKLARVKMTVVPASENEPVEYVAISVDQGATWVTCRHLSGANWACEFSTNNPPKVSEYSELKIVARN